MSAPLIDLVGITKQFDDTLVLDDLNLSIQENEFMTLLAAAKQRLCVSLAASRRPTRASSFLKARRSPAFPLISASSTLSSRSTPSSPI